jgi:hypothetical protein
LQYSKEELRRMGWRGEVYFSNSQNGKVAPYIDDMDSDSDYSYDDLSGVPEHLLSKSWQDPSIIKTYAPKAGPPSAMASRAWAMEKAEEKQQEKNKLRERVVPLTIAKLRERVVQSGGVENASLSNGQEQKGGLKCSQCKVNQGAENFSTKQLKKKSKRRCAKCVEQEVAHVVPALSGSLP